MTSESSVNPPSSKLPWGTILKPNFGLGHQKLSEEEIEAVVARLNQVSDSKEPSYVRPNKDMSQEEINGMLERLTKCKEIPDSDRRVVKSIYKDMGVVASYAWKGFN
ncbi:uncharacterized protein LOC124261727 [Haliotis rubra]|uniref:uncharacterized protein LOC124261727 n=1 Tax=Haliotis rubra TaxID=36100 RepID=UPI001EE5F919|nr:uncharacterized protein LOC124261727 [Haliotis rubra]XP_046552033.1 uncharacterized protein LOC124261727 [Haliotis rubra]XP_046552034.1 uncharacterized protein LOC124261727 [Haliotis rubra]